MFLNIVLVIYNIELQISYNYENRNINSTF